MKRFSSEARTLQWIDRWMGAPVCCLLTCFRRLSRLFGAGKAQGPIEKILFLKLAEQGSTVLAHEAVNAAVARVGRDKVYFLVFEENRFVVDLIGLVPPSNVLTIRTRSAWTMVASALRILSAVREKKFDVCIDMEFFARFSAAICYLTGARRRVGFHVYFGEGPYRGDLMTHRVLYNPHLHTSRTFMSLVQALDKTPELLPTLAVIPPEPPPLPRFEPAPGEQAQVEAILARLGVPRAERLIVLNANAGDLLPLRRWDSANYQSLASRLAAAFPEAWIVFTGSPEEAPRIAEMVRSIGLPRVICVAGLTTLRQLVVLFGLSEVLVTNDSGPAHFAALTGVDVIALFGPETPLLFAAPGARSHPVWARIACSPCVNAFNNRQTACRDNQCMKAISVDQVYELACGIYRSRVGCAQADKPA